MRTILLLLLAMPFIANAQINRSARELATERTQEYIVNKLFKGNEYKPVSYGELKAWNDTRSPISWTFVHTFEVTTPNSGYDDKPADHKTYNFLFYLDKQMKVLKAESYYHN